MKLGFLGPKGTFSYEACKLYNCNFEHVEYNSIFETFEALKNNKVDEIIVPIENSLQGGVTETIDILAEENDFFIKKEIVIEIKQNLLANRYYKLDEIRELYSHPQALAQCRNFIQNNLKNVNIVKVSSTAIAAKEIKNQDYSACIANKDCVDQFGLKLLEENIHDNNQNKTRFWVLNKEQNTSGSKMSIIFATKNKPGALYKVLGILYKNKINMSKIESRPAKTALGQYIFLVDVDVSEKIDDAIKELRIECDNLKILGKY